MADGGDRSDSVGGWPGERGPDDTDPALPRVGDPAAPGPGHPHPDHQHPDYQHPGYQHPGYPNGGYSPGPGYPQQPVPPLGSASGAWAGTDQAPFHPGPGYAGLGYAGPGYPPPAGTPTSLRSLGRAVQILLGLTMVAGLVMLAADAQQYLLARRLANRPLSFEQAEADASDQFVTLGGGFWSAMMIATGVVFIVWLFRLRRDAGLWAPDDQRWGQGATIWGWLLIVNFWVPYGVAKDALRATFPDGSTGREGRGTLRFWWTFWVLMVIAGGVDRILTQQLDEAADLHSYLDKLVSYTANALLYDVVALVGAVGAILVVRLLTAAHEARLASGAPVRTGLGPGGSGRPVRRSGWSRGY